MVAKGSENGSQRNPFVHGHRRGKSSSPTYISWLAMNQRCHNRRHQHWEFYGGAGIRVHPDWRGRGGFERFLAHVGPRPKGHTLDRIDRELGYVPGNVRWANAYVQAFNHGKVQEAKRYRAPGPDGKVRELTVSEWATLLQMRPDTLRLRIRKGMGDRAFSTPLGGFRAPAASRAS